MLFGVRVGVTMMKRAVKPEIRKARPTDKEAILALAGRVGFDSPYDPAVTGREPASGLTAGSRRCADAKWPRPENPALSFRDPPPPIGWVIEAEDRIVGHLGNIPQLYQFAQRTLLAVARTGFIVEPEYRTLSLRLAAKSYHQPNVDLLLGTTTSQVGGTVAKAFHSLPIPTPNYDQALFWITGEVGFAAAALSRLGVPRPLATLARWPTAAALRIDSFRRKPRRISRTRDLQVTSLALVEVGEEFDELWRRKLEEPPRLMAWRTSTALKWHYHARDHSGGVHVVCCRRGSELRGYLILARFDAADIGLKRLRVVDMLVLDDEHDVIDALLAAAYDHGRATRDHVVELIGFPTSIKCRMLAGRPYVRRLPSWPYYYRARDDEIARKLENPDVWYPSPYDGDASL